MSSISANELSTKLYAWAEADDDRLMQELTIAYAPNYSNAYVIEGSAFEDTTGAPLQNSGMDAVRMDTTSVDSDGNPNSDGYTKVALNSNSPTLKEFDIYIQTNENEAAVTNYVFKYDDQFIKAHFLTFQIMNYRVSSGVGPGAVDEHFYGDYLLYDLVNNDVSGDYHTDPTYGGSFTTLADDNGNTESIKFNNYYSNLWIKFKPKDPIVFVAANEPEPQPEPEPEPEIDYNVTASGGKYIINGKEQLTILLERNQTYTFYNDSNSAHPFKFSDSHEGAIYSTNVIDNGDGYINITIDNNTPDTLYYKCDAHSNMGGKLLVVNEAKKVDLEMLDGDVIGKKKILINDLKEILKPYITFDINNFSSASFDNFNAEMKDSWGLKYNEKMYTFSIVTCDETYAYLNLLSNKIEEDLDLLQIGNVDNKITKRVKLYTKHYTPDFEAKKEILEDTENLNTKKNKATPEVVQTGNKVEFKNNYFNRFNSLKTKWQNKNRQN